MQQLLQAEKKKQRLMGCVSASLEKVEPITNSFFGTKIARQVEQDGKVFHQKKKTEIKTKDGQSFMQRFAEGISTEFSQLQYKRGVHFPMPLS